MNKWCKVSAWLSCLLCCLCFSIDMSTTEIYTYGHTRALHDALPFCTVLRTAGKAGTPPDRSGPSWPLSSGRTSRWLTSSTSPRDLIHAARSSGRPRSEEHTSAIQSLMRTSYAVFCLKNKTKQPQNLAEQEAIKPTSNTTHTQ